MQRHREKSPAGTIVISAIITLVVMGALTFLLVYFGLPSIPISQELLYSSLLRLLPIIIGLILVLIALTIQPPRIPKDTDKTDEIGKDNFTAPLYNLPDEEEQRSYGRAQLSVPKPTPSTGKQSLEAASQTANRVPDIAPTITPFTGAPAKPAQMWAPEPEKWTPAEPFEIQKQAEVDSIPVEIPPELDIESTEQTTDLGRAVLFGEYPFSIPPGSDIAALLEPIEETFESGDLRAEDLILVEDTFETRLDDELASAVDLGYDLSIAVIDVPHHDADTHSVDATVVQNLFNRLGIVSFFYLTEVHRVSAILPFHGFEQCRRYFASLLENLRKHHPESTVTVGFSSVNGREITAEGITEEATIAADLAHERGGYSLIGYDTDLEPTLED